MGKIGLVLEGGAMRGLFTAGVIDVFLQHGIRLDGVVGVSAGACFGCNYPSGQMGRALRYNLTYCRDARYSGLRSLVRTGNLYGPDFCYREVPYELDPFDFAAFDQSGIPFWVVCTSVSSGKPVYHLCEKADRDMMEWVRASASMPVVSRPVEREGDALLDGGIVDPIPLGFAIEQGYDHNVVVLTQTRTYRKRRGKGDALMRRLLRKQPVIAEAMRRRPDVYNAQQEFAFEQEREGRAFVLCPDVPVPAHRVEHDAQRLTDTYFAGVRVAERELDRLSAFIQRVREES